MRFFNTEGPIRPDEHYHLPPAERLDLDGALMLIRQKKYFVLALPGRRARPPSCWRSATCSTMAASIAA